MDAHAYDSPVDLIQLLSTHIILRGYLFIGCFLGNLNDRKELGYYVWFYVLEQVSAAVTSSFLFAEPLVTVSFAVMFVGEEISMSILAGGLLIFIGVYLVTRIEQ